MPKPETIRNFLLAAASCFLLAGPAVAGSYDDALNAARLGDTKALVGLLQKGLEVDTVDAQGNTLLILAAREGNADTVKALLGFRPKLDYRNPAGDSALMLAVLRGHERAAEVLIEGGAAVNHEDWTALHYAAFEGRLALLERLIAAGADLGALAPNKSDALMLAARNGHIDVVRRLLKAGVALDRTNDAGFTAESWALANGNTDIAGLISEARKRR